MIPEKRIIPRKMSRHSIALAVSVCCMRPVLSLFVIRAYQKGSLPVFVLTVVEDSFLIHKPKHGPVNRNQNSRLRGCLQHYMSYCRFKRWQIYLGPVIFLSTWYWAILLVMPNDSSSCAVLLLLLCSEAAWAGSPNCLLSSLLNPS